MRIASVDSICINYIPDIISSFRARYQNVEVTVCQGGYADVLMWLHTGYADLGFLSRTLPCDNLAATDVFRDRIMCLTSQEYAAEHPGKTHITAADIQGQSIVLQRDGYDAEALAVLKKLEINTVCEFAVASDHSIIALVECGLGMCFMPKLILSRILHNAAVYPIYPDMFRTAVIAYEKGPKLSNAAQTLHTHILDFFANTDTSALL